MHSVARTIDSPVHRPNSLREIPKRDECASVEVCVADLSISDESTLHSYLPLSARRCHIARWWCCLVAKCDDRLQARRLKYSGGQKSGLHSSSIVDSTTMKV
jgi:hypothetical protein